jgi:hypothetical protein
VVEWRFSDVEGDWNRYAADVDGRQLIVAFPRLDEMDPGLATWHAYWEDEHRAGVDRTFTGEVRFKHHVTAYDAGLVIERAARVAPDRLPGNAASH